MNVWFVSEQKINQSRIINFSFSNKPSVNLDFIDDIAGVIVKREYNNL